MGIVAGSMVLLWIVVAVLLLALIALARQIGVLHERIAPVGALKVDNGPGVGQKAPKFKVTTLDGETAHIGERLRSGDAQLLMFVSPDCPICKKLIPVAKAFARDERLSVLFVSDGDVLEQRKMIGRFALQGIPFVNSAEVGMRFGVGKLPYAVLIDHEGTVAASGLVNSREHLESLVVAKQMGVPSLQAYLQRRVADSADIH